MASEERTEGRETTEESGRPVKRLLQYSRQEVKNLRWFSEVESRNEIQNVF